MTDLDAMSCAKCKSKMEEGFLHSLSKISFVIVPAGKRWGSLRGTPVRTFRCTVCGYLESYARLTR
jgi:hypothetical protein